MAVGRAGGSIVVCGGVTQVFRINQWEETPCGVKSLVGAEPPRWGGPNSDGEAFVSGPNGGAGELASVTGRLLRMDPNRSGGAQ
jgi:hypothetical protein